jgi:hypothetical protein
MLAGYGRYANDNIRTGHLKCPNCRTRTHLAKIECDDDGREVRSFACQHCAAVTELRLPAVGDSSDTLLRDLGNR